MRLKKTTHNERLALSGRQCSEKGNEISEMFFGKRVVNEWLTEDSFQAIRGY